MRSKIRFYNLSPEMKSNVRDGAILTAAIAGGYGMFKIFGSSLFSKKETIALSELPADEQEEIISEKFELSDDTGIEVETDLPVVESTQEQSFAEAFSEARAELGPGGFFNFKGQTYSTFYDEEFNAKSADEQDAYAQEIDDHIYTDSAEEFNVSESLASSLEDDDQQIIVDPGLDQGHNNDIQEDVIISSSIEVGETDDIIEETMETEDIVISEELEALPMLDLSGDLDLSGSDQETMSDEFIDSITSDEINENISLETDASIEGNVSEVDC